MLFAGTWGAPEGQTSTGAALRKYGGLRSYRWSVIECNNANDKKNMHHWDYILYNILYLHYRLELQISWTLEDILECNIIWWWQISPPYHFQSWSLRAPALSVCGDDFSFGILQKWHKNWLNISGGGGLRFGRVSKLRSPKKISWKCLLFLMETDGIWGFLNLHLPWPPSGETDHRATWDFKTSTQQSGGTEVWFPSRMGELSLSRAGCFRM